MKMATEISQGAFPPLKVCIDPLSEYNSWNFSRGYPTELSLPLGMKKFSGSPNNSITFSLMPVWRLPLDEGEVD